jgi:hypothetical protein
LKPEEVVPFLTIKYDFDVLNYHFVKYFTSEYERKGACDTRPHEIVMKFEGDNDKVLGLKVSSVKSSGDNCLINAMQ